MYYTRKATVQVPAICFDLMQPLRAIFGDTLAMKAEEVIREIQQRYPHLAKGSEELRDLLRYLSVMGMVSYGVIDTLGSRQQKGPSAYYKNFPGRNFKVDVCN